ncbi:MobA/MobL family protein [Psychrobacter cibarius]|uniref:MobA/MobL family protein n=1 Tax=Psychrobacter cibarius TaxID=282669 RepID=UPI0018DFB23C|nr:MobA/MobL family protein [Psychrobacter cibarius]
MTIVHFDTKAISRKAGQSAVACAAYRAGDVLDDVRYGKTHDYSKKRGVMSSDIVLPFALKALGVSVDRETLWNLAEAAENRSDSRVAREWLINLPYELSEEERHTLAIEFAQKLVDDMDVIADVCIHRPVMKLPFDPEAKPSSKRLREGEQNPDPRNFHAHILVTTRAPIAGPNKTLAFDPKLKIPFEWSNKKRLAHDLPSSMKEIKRMRQIWVDTANVVLAKKQLPLMDARSYKDQGRDQQPTIKMGVAATAMERRGITTEKGDINREIIARNQAVTEQTSQQGVEHDRRVRALRKGLAWTTEHNARLPSLIGDTKQRADSTQRRISDTTSGIAWATERCQKIPNGIDTVNNRIKSADDGINWATDHTESLPELIKDTAQLITNTKPNLEWTAERTEELHTRRDDTQQRIDKAAQRIDDSKRWVTQNSERVQASKSITDGINSGLTERARPAPSPFDDDYQRAFYERKRRVDRAIRETDRKLDESRVGDVQRSNDVEDAVKTLTYRLLDRRKEGLFDNRKLIMLDDFAKKLGINENQSLDFKQNVRLATDKINTVEVLENNPHVFRLLNFPSQEREHYQTVTADFDRFIAHVDKQRAELRQKYQSKLGRNDTSRVTAEILTVEPYLAALTKYANNSEKTDESRALAEQHINKTIRLTAKKYEIAYKGLNTLDRNESVQKHIRELGVSLNNLTTDYSNKLTESDLRSINEGLKAIDTGIEISNTSQRIVTQNLGPSISI